MGHENLSGNKGFQERIYRNKNNNTLLIFQQFLPTEKVTGDPSELSAGEHAYHHLFSEETLAQERMIVVIGGFPPIESYPLERLCKEYAALSQTQVVFISPLARKASLQDDAQAIMDFLKENNIQEVLLVGHSKGARIAEDVAHLQGNEDSPKIRGLILTNPAGVYRQGVFQLLSGVLQNGSEADRVEAYKSEDEKKSTPSMPTRKREPDSQERKKIREQDGIDDIRGTWKRVLWRRGAVWEIYRELKQIAEVSTYFDQLCVPTVVFAGIDDMIFRIGKIAERLDTSAQKIKVVRVRKDSHHAGAIFYRPHTFAAASLAMIERLQRDKARHDEE